jgi:hypothetical protein
LVWRRIGALVPAAVLVLVPAALLVPVAVLAAFLLLWGASLELEGGAFLAVGVLRVRAGDVLTDAVVSYALP